MRPICAIRWRHWQVLRYLALPGPLPSLFFPPLFSATSPLFFHGSFDHEIKPLSRYLVQQHVRHNASLFHTEVMFFFWQVSIRFFDFSSGLNLRKLTETWKVSLKSEETVGGKEEGEQRHILRQMIWLLLIWLLLFKVLKLKPAAESKLFKILTF